MNHSKNRCKIVSKDIIFFQQNFYTVTCSNYGSPLSNQEQIKVSAPMNGRIHTAEQSIFLETQSTGNFSPCFKTEFHNHKRRESIPPNPWPTVSVICNPIM